MGIMILVQKAAVFLLMALALFSTLVLTGVGKWRHFMPSSHLATACLSILFFLGFVAFYTVLIGYRYHFWIFSIEIIDALPPVGAH